MDQTDRFKVEDPQIQSDSLAFHSLFVYDSDIGIYIFTSHSATHSSSAAHAPRKRATTNMLRHKRQQRGQLWRGRRKVRQQQPPCAVLFACYWLAVAQSVAIAFTPSHANFDNFRCRTSLTTSSAPCRHRPAFVPVLSKARSYKRRRHAGLRTAEAKTDGKEVVMATENGGLLRGDCEKTVVVVGGGAAGYFGAIQAASSSISGCDSRQPEEDPHLDSSALDGKACKLNVVVLEAGKMPLQKVKISGGGRCNVMHDTSKAISLIAQGYPRGSKQLIGPFKSLFGPVDAAAWFRTRGVTLKTEGDGRMFPTTDDSQTIIDCLEGAARQSSIEVITSARVTSIARQAGDNDSNTEAEGNRPGFDLTFATATALSPVILRTLRAKRTPSLAPESASAEAEGGIGAGLKSSRGPGGESSDGAANGARVSYDISCDYVLQATGAAKEGHGWARNLGHLVSNPVPSLFTLTIRDQRLENLAGLSVQDAELKLFAAEQTADVKGAISSISDNVKGNIDGGKGGDGYDRSFEAVEARSSGGNETVQVKKKKKKGGKRTAAASQRGPLLITHTGVSGPAALKLSAFGARILNEGGYKGKLFVNWMAGNNPSKTLDDLQSFRARNLKKTVYGFCPITGNGGTDGGGRSSAHRAPASALSPSPSPSALPRRLWQSLAHAAGIIAEDKWADVSKAKLSALAQQLTACEFQIVGKGSFKEEFVTCGGVALSALDMRTMESKTVPGLFFAGEVVDVDGITGGFNFQSAWTTGWVAGSAIAARAATDHASITAATATATTDLINVDTCVGDSGADHSRSDKNSVPRDGEVVLR